MSSNLSYHFAIALVRLGKRAGTLGALAKDLDSVVRMLAAERRAKLLLVHPRVPFAEKKKFLEAICETEPVVRLVLMLVEIKNLDLLETINSQFAAMVAKELGIVEATVETASPLSGEDTKKLQAAISGLTGATVELEARTDPALLAGVRIRIGDTVFDNTLKTELEIVRERLAPS